MARIRKAKERPYSKDHTKALSPFTIQQQLKDDFAAAKISRFRRRRPHVPLTGANADYHFNSESDVFRMMEYARDMYRNDAIVSRLLNVAVLNTVQNGFIPDPSTPDAALNLDLWQRFTDWASDPNTCDASGQFTFAQMQEMILRAALLDGDIFALPIEDGTLQLVEAHRCRTPHGADKSIVYGVELDKRRRRQRYWFTDDDLDPLAFISARDKCTPYEARDLDGTPLVMHVYDPARYTQTRGVTVFAPVFDMLGMIEDIQFAKLVQQQSVSCFGLVYKRLNQAYPGQAARAPLGPQSTESEDGLTKTTERLAPGVVLEPPPGVDVEAWSSNIPNAEYFPHIKLAIQTVAVHLGVPYNVAMLDASDTNFSGFRGAVDQGRIQFTRNQSWLADTFFSPVYNWRARIAISEDSAMRRAFEKFGARFFDHSVRKPRWQYIQPLQDAQADELRIRSRLSSPRRVHSERGADYDEVIAETVADNAAAIRQAVIAAMDVYKQTGAAVDAARFLSIDGETKLFMPEKQDDARELLNGAQVTAAIDVMTKLRDNTIEPLPATELLTSIGIQREKAVAMVTATPRGRDDSASDVQFKRDLVKAFMADGVINDVVYNLTDIEDLLTQVNVPLEQGTEAPWLPVVAQDGSLVTGDTITDGSGAIVGGVSVSQATEEPRNGDEN